MRAAGDKWPDLYFILMGLEPDCVLDHFPFWPAIKFNSWLPARTTKTALNIQIRMHVAAAATRKRRPRMGNTNKSHEKRGTRVFPGNARLASGCKTDSQLISREREKGILTLLPPTDKLTVSST
jgi:hypothetical protein